MTRPELLGTGSVSSDCTTEIPIANNVTGSRASGVTRKLMIVSTMCPSLSTTNTPRATAIIRAA